MKILVDENIPLITVAFLKQKGHDVADIRGSREQAMPDDELWHKAVREQRLLITTDKGFSYYRNQKHSGLVIVALRQPNRTKIHQRIIEALDAIPNIDSWPGRTLIMRDHTMSSWQKN